MIEVIDILADVRAELRVVRAALAGDEKRNVTGAVRMTLHALEKRLALAERLVINDARERTPASGGHR